MCGLFGATIGLVSRSRSDGGDVIEMGRFRGNRQRRGQLQSRLVSKRIEAFTTDWIEKDEKEGTSVGEGAM